MRSSLFLGAAIAALAQLAHTRPVAQPTVEVNLVKRISGLFDKRSESGPKIGGANFPDPSIIGYNNGWYAFATRTRGTNVHIQVAYSSDFSNWSIVKNSDGSQKDALPNLPSWVVPGAGSNTWAPDVSRLDDGTFVMYYSASTTSDTTKHCVGAAKATQITGPYTPVSSQPLVCDLSVGGAIDASGFNDNGKRYLLWKVDGNSIGHGGACGNTVAPIVPTPIKVQALANDGITLQGSATTILDNLGASEEGIIEAPSLTHVNGIWILYFSGNCFTGSNYNVNYATSSSITGPYTRAARPLFKSGDFGLSGPGGADIDRYGVNMLFHANYGSGRALYQAQVSVNGKVVTA
ncbi:hypothetical protein LTR95_015600 [Oleoguttula sp. CCFEE 5521]